MNVGEWSHKRARLWPDHHFLKQSEQCCTNREFNDRVNRMAHVLMAKGIQKGDRVATLMVNCSAFLEIFFACAKTGAIVVPVNHYLAVPELVRIIADCGPRVLIHSPCFAVVVEQLRNCGGPVECYLQHAGGALAAASGCDDPADPRTATEPPVNPDGTQNTESARDPLAIYRSSSEFDILSNLCLNRPDDPLK